MKYIAGLIAAVQAASDGYEPNEYEHTHVEYGEETRFRDVLVYYDEIEYNILSRPETEVRTRQVPVTNVCLHEETKYRPAEEIRFTTEYEIKYRPNVYTRHTWEPR